MPDETFRKRRAPEWIAALQDEAIDACRILYGYRKLGWECNDGWNVPLAGLSYALEELNLRYWKKCRIRIVAEQVKEKFGTLRFYYTVLTQQPLWRRLPGMALNALRELIRRKVDFKLKTVMVQPAKTVHEYELLSEEKDPAVLFNAALTTYKDRLGKTYSVRKYSAIPKTRTVPEKHKVLYIFCEVLQKARIWLTGKLETAKPTRTQLIISKYMYDEAERLIKRAEDECFHKCEICGKDIGTDWSPRCMTVPGWISFLCEDCIPEGSRYEKCGKTFVKGQTAPAEDSDEDKA